MPMLTSTPADQLPGPRFVRVPNFKRSCLGSPARGSFRTLVAVTRGTRERERERERDRGRDRGIEGEG